MIRRLLPAVLLFLAATTAGAALRDDLGDAKVRAIEAALAAAVPGSTLEWTTRLTVSLPDGAKSVVRIVGPREYGTAIYVVHLELTDFVRAALAHAESFSADPPPARPTDFLAAVQLAATPVVRITRLDPTARAIEVKKLEVIPETEAPQTWPGLSVTYWATYATPDWTGAVRWTGAYNVETLSHVARMPLTITKRRATGDIAADPVSTTRASAEIVQIEGGLTGQVIGYPCPAPCLFDGKTLLAAWGTTGAAAAE